MFGYSDYTFPVLFFYALYESGGFMSRAKKDFYIQKGKDLRQKMLDKLGSNGVLFYPTFPQAALRHNESCTKLAGTMYTMFFNIIGFPSTHVPVSESIHLISEFKIHELIN
jgi:fatty acid amide hydrolase 2